MACAQAGKALAYSTFQDEFFEKELQQTYDNLVASECTVGKHFIFFLYPSTVRRINCAGFSFRVHNCLLSANTVQARCEHTAKNVAVIFFMMGGPFVSEYNEIVGKVMGLLSSCTCIARSSRVQIVS
ncbi:unnamed protein product [Dibothriocephalus latus]|uniref:Uncharacterized protein n=1 Tax=Dibothriocephalus latus TaxID=60516 RepID=A0A3P7LT53_DIBLA|nr:unnamed protein product [Dibothriocephalus latus]